VLPRPLPAAALVMRCRNFGRGVQAVARGWACCAMQELHRGAQADARGAVEVLDRGAQAVVRGTAR
jgi:hypothetical protein